MFSFFYLIADWISRITHIAITALHAWRITFHFSFLKWIQHFRYAFQKNNNSRLRRAGGRERQAQRIVIMYYNHSRNRRCNHFVAYCKCARLLLDEIIPVSYTGIEWLTKMLDAFHNMIFSLISGHTHQLYHFRHFFSHIQTYLNLIRALCPHFQFFVWSFCLITPFLSLS